MVSIVDHGVFAKLNNLIEDGAHEGDLSKAIASMISGGNRDSLRDIFVMLFHTRDIREGKGKRLVTNIMWYILLSNPNTKELALHLLDLVPEYGCWRDLFILLQENETTDVSISELKKVIYGIVLKQFRNDEVSMLEGKPISFLAKWIPRENRMSLYARDLASLLFPGEKRLSSRLAMYRKRVAALNRYLNTVEVSMCENNWSSINPSTVPSVALHKYKKAFLNLKVNSEDRLRHPQDSERMACRDNFQDYFISEWWASFRTKKPERKSEDIITGERYNAVRDKVAAYFQWLDGRSSSAAIR